MLRVTKSTVGRSAESAKTVMGDFEGTVMCDGYKAYETLARGSPNIRLAHCWAHARRKFVEARPNYPNACDQALDWTGLDWTCELFANYKKSPNPYKFEGLERIDALKERARIRDEDSRPIVTQRHDWSLQQRGLPKSGVRKAVEYMQTCWGGLTSFLDDPFIGLDNNPTERALRNLVVGRKNHYGSRSERGTEVAALFYTLIETCKMNDIGPTDYLYEASKLAINKPGTMMLPFEMLKS